MSCLHAEDVCQHCLEKVHTTEDAPQTKRSPTEKTMTPKQKRDSLLFDSSLLVAFGAIGFFCTKVYYKIYSHIYHSSLGVIHSLWDTLETPSHE